MKLSQEAIGGLKNLRSSVFDFEEFWLMDDLVSCSESVKRMEEAVSAVREALDARERSQQS
jgi:hypothetical protein